MMGTRLVLMDAQILVKQSSTIHVQELAQPVVLLYVGMECREDQKPVMTTTRIILMDVRVFVNLNLAIHALE